MRLNVVPLVLLAVFSVGCAQVPPGGSAGMAVQPGSGPSRGSLVALIGEARCTGDAQCRSLAVGASPCGGPEGYLAWSTSATDAGALAAEAERYAMARREANQRSGRVGTCVFLDDPGAYCAPSGRCELRATRGRPGTGAR